MTDNGIIRASDVLADLQTMKVEGCPRMGVSTGFPDADPYLLLERGYMSIVTGIPSSGKSEWMDAVAVNMAYEHGWRWAIFSPENFPVKFHFRKLHEKYIGKSLREMTSKELARATEWSDEHFVIVYPEKTPTTNDIIRIFEGLNMKDEFHGCIIDPWNELDHSTSHSMRDDQYIGEQLTNIRRFGRRNNMHVCIVVHPVKMQKDKNGDIGKPGPYDINGGAMWRNKADYCITAHREDMATNRIEISTTKIKFKSMGKIGAFELDYDVASGRFKGIDEDYYRLPNESPF